MIGYGYGIGAAHSVQFSLVVNYNLRTGKELQLAEIFKRNSNYLNLISNYCIRELSDQGSQLLFKEHLDPRSENFESWSVTHIGIRFNFDSCKISPCAEGKQEVEIPFITLEQLLNPTILKLVPFS